MRGEFGSKPHDQKFYGSGISCAAQRTVSAAMLARFGPNELDQSKLYTGQALQFELCAPSSFGDATIFVSDG